MRKTLYLAVSLLVLAACGCGKPQTLPIIPSGQESGTGGKETIPEPGITYATEVLTLPATARDHYQIYQVNLKLYGSSGAFGNTANFILNNGGNGVQLENFDVLKGQTVTRDFYFHFTADNVTVVE